MNIIRKKDGFIGEFLYVASKSALDNMENNPLFEYIKITDIGYFPNASHHYRERSHGIGSYILIYCDDGEGFFSIDSSPIHGVKKGDLLLIPAGKTHFYGADPQNPWSIYWAHMQGAMLQNYVDNTLIHNPAQANFLINEKIKTLFQDIFNYLEHPYNSEVLFPCSQIMAHIIGLSSLAFENSVLLNSSSRTAIDTVEKVITYMHNNIYNSLTIESLAQVAVLSPSYLSGVFKKATGLSPIRYFLNMKIQKASEDLYFTSRQVKDVALSYGFDDPSYFSRIFKKQMGVSPVQYQKQIKG